MLSALQIQEINRLLILKGCNIKRDGEYLSSRTGDYIYMFNKEEQALRERQTKLLGNFFTKDWFEILFQEFSGKKILDWLQIKDKDLDLSIKSHKNFNIWNYYYGIDLCGPQFNITDLNCDRANIVGFQDEIIEIFRQFYPNINYRGFYENFIPLINIFNIKPERTFVLTHPNEPFIIPLQNFAKKFNFQVGSISDLDLSKTEIVIRQIKSEEIISNPTKYKKLLTALKSGLPMINPLGSFIAGHKGWMTLLTATGIIPKEWFPKSWLLSNKTVLSSENNVIDIDGFLGLLKDSKKKNTRQGYILKKGFTAGGRSIFIGEDLKRHQWEALIEMISNSEESWVIEEKLPRNLKTITVGVWNKRIDIDPTDIEILSLQLNQIQRIYSTYPFNNFTGEVFASNSNKVNASGYTFPVGFN